MAATTVEVQKQTTEQYDEAIANDAQFQQAIQNAEDRLYIDNDESYKINLSEKLAQDLLDVDDHAEALQKDPQDEKSRVSLRKAFIQFLKGILKKFLHPKTGESGGVINVGDLNVEGNKAKMAFFKKIYNLHVPDTYLNKKLIHFILAVSKDDYQMQITSEADVISESGLTPFERDLLDLPPLLRRFFVDKVLKSPEVSAELRITDPEIQLDRRLLLEDSSEGTLVTPENFTTLKEQVRQEVMHDIAQDNVTYKKKKGEEGLNEAQIKQLESYRDALKAHFDLDREYDAEHLRELRKNTQDYMKVQNYFSLGKERGAAAYGKDPTEFEAEVNRLLLERGVAGGIAGVDHGEEMLRLSEVNRNANIDRSEFDVETQKKLTELNPNRLAKFLITKNGFDFGAAAEISEEIQGLVATFFDKVDTLPNEEYSKLYSEYNQGRAFYTIQNYFFGMSNNAEFEKAFNDIEDEKLRAKAREDARVFFKQKTFQNILKRRTNSELFHNMFRILSKIDIAKWSEYMTNIDVSELASEIDNRVSPYAMQIWLKLIRKQIIKADGYIPSNLFEIKYVPDSNGEKQEKMDINPLQKEFLRELQYVLKANHIDAPDWMKTQAFTKSKAISAMLMYTTAQLSQAKINKDFDKTPIHDKIRLHGGPGWMYGAGMGGRDIVKMAFLQMLEYSPTEFHGGAFAHLKALNDKRYAHNPKALADKAKMFVNYDENNISLEEFQEWIGKLESYQQDPDHRHTWYNMQRRFALQDVIGQGAWGIKGIGKAYDQYLEDIYHQTGITPYEGKKWEETTMEQKYDYFQREMGARTEFLFAVTRAEEETKEFFTYDYYEKYCHRHHITPKPQEGWSNKGLKLGVHIYGRHHEELMDEEEYKQKRYSTNKGRAFYHLLLNDPETFLANLYSKMDQLSEGTVVLDDANKTRMDADAFYLDTDQSSDVFKQMSKKDQDRIRKFQHYATSRFRIDKTPQNKEDLRFIMKFYKKLNDHYQDPKVAYEQLHTYLLIAHNRAIYRMDQKHEKGFLTPEDFRINPEEFKDLQEDTINPNDAKFIEELILGEEGLITHFKNIVGGEENEGLYWGDEMINHETHQKVKSRESLGNIDGFFYRWAEAHYDIDGFVTDPMEAYFNLKKFFPYANEAGPEMLGRRIGQYKPFSEMQYNNFVKFYSALKKASLKPTSHEGGGHGKTTIFDAFDQPEGVTSILKKMKELDEYIGSTPGYREFTEQLTAVALSYVAMNSYIEKPYALNFTIPGLSSLNLFGRNKNPHEGANAHSHKKGLDITIPVPIPPFIRPFIKAFLGENSSLSRQAFKQEKRAYEATMDEMRAYIHHLENDGVLGKEQAERLVSQFHLETKYMILFRFLPDLMYYLLALLGVSAFQEGFKEFTDETGGGGGGRGHH
jgi:hypothetical protein